MQFVKLFSGCTRIAFGFIGVAQGLLVLLANDVQVDVAFQNGAFQLLGACEQDGDETRGEGRALECDFIDGDFSQFVGFHTSKIDKIEHLSYEREGDGVRETVGKFDMLLAGLLWLLGLLGVWGLLRRR